jgi:glutaredoxin-like protein
MEQTFINEKTRKELKTVLSAMKEPVTIIYFNQESACPMCREQQKILIELAGISEKLKLIEYDFIINADKVLEYRIDKIPATIVMGKQDYGIRFYGVTAGYEFSSLVETIMMISQGRSGLSPEIEQLILTIDEPVHLQVMTTVTCPYCPRAVMTCNQMAYVNDNIRSDMIEMTEFPMLVQRYNVSGVPVTIINEVNRVEGALPAESFYLEVLKAVKPEEYQKLEELIRESRGERNVSPADESHTYETVIVGGGPAAMSSALYAARKDMDVLIVARSLGGQITYTAVVDNFLGLPDIGGKEMANHFRFHMERYPISEHLGFFVSEVRNNEGIFEVVTEDGKVFRGLSVIYCAGKEYRRLGIPGEERFIGRGIAFCATCDAPLYRSRNVAVIGGGNSALTAVRDLTSFASQVFLIHRRSEFTADASLVKEVTQSKNLKIYMDTVVREIIGTEKLSGIRVMSTDGKERIDLPVDGVFLEIGLSPNTDPVKNLLTLTDSGEIPVKKNNSTELDGFFAAGDATDIGEKQISIAVGDGAKAALAAHHYLVDRKLTRSTVQVGSEWQ